MVLNSSLNEIWECKKMTHCFKKMIKTLLSLVLQDPSESVFWAGFCGLNTSWKGIWSTRVLTPSNRKQNIPQSSTKYWPTFRKQRKSFLCLINRGGQPSFTTNTLQTTNLTMENQPFEDASHCISYQKWGIFQLVMLVFGGKHLSFIMLGILLPHHRAATVGWQLKKSPKVGGRKLWNGKSWKPQHEKVRDVHKSNVAQPWNSFKTWHAIVTDSNQTTRCLSPWIANIA